MTTQNYVMVNEQTKVADNVCLWDGNTETWQPPAGYLMLVQATTPSKEWSWDSATQTWNLAETVGTGGIGYTWDGTYLITDQPMPEPDADKTIIGGTQPATTGTQTL